jgi:hypothetical protein
MMLRLTRKPTVHGRFSVTPVRQLYMARADRASEDDDEYSSSYKRFELNLDQIFRLHRAAAYMADGDTGAASLLDIT